MIRAALSLTLLSLGCHAVAYTDVPVTWTLVGENGIHVLTCREVGNPMVTWNFVLDGGDTVSIPLACDQSGTIVRVPEGPYMMIDAEVSNELAVPCFPGHDEPLTHLDACVLLFTAEM
jgi:hypothetical protein